MRAGVIGVLAAAFLALPATASAYTYGTVSGANIDRAGTTVSVTNLRVDFDECGGSYPPQFGFPGGFGGCGAQAGVVPAFETCPSDGNGAETLWDQGGTLYASEGPRTY